MPRRKLPPPMLIVFFSFLLPFYFGHRRKGFLAQRCSRKSNLSRDDHFVFVVNYLTNLPLSASPQNERFCAIPQGTAAFAYVTRATAAEWNPLSPSWRPFSVANPSSRCSFTRNTAMNLYNFRTSVYRFGTLTRGANRRDGGAPFNLKPRRSPQR